MNWCVPSPDTHLTNGRSVCRCVCDNIHNKGILHTVIFLFIFCNEVMLSPKLLKHAEFNKLHLSLIDNHFSTYGYLILTSGPYNCCVVEVEGTSQIWP